MDTKKFKAKTELEFRNNGHLNNVFFEALDIGYSAIKLFGPCVIARIPAYAKRVGEDFSFISNVSDLALIYTDNVTHEKWLVGEIGQAQIGIKDTSESEAALYGRERYKTPMFKVLARVGLAIGMLNKKDGKYLIDYDSTSKKLVVQSGLPEKYLNMDKPLLTEALAGKHDFTLQIGTQELNFCFELMEENVFVMSQPLGTLFSVCIENNYTWHKDATKIMKSSALVFDPGFGTLDVFPIKEGAVNGNGETFEDYSMKQVMKETTEYIRKQGIEISVPAFQKYLDEGVVKYIDRKGEPIVVDFKEILKKNSEKICKEALEKIFSIYDINDYKYLIVTGGTGAAWFHIIKENFSAAIEYEIIELINGNRNDNLSFVYSNVRGYYLYRFLKLQAIHGRES